ncbi:vacuolar protein sorting-associated protein 70 [[Candida] anglica]
MSRDIPHTPNEVRPLIVGRSTDDELERGVVTGASAGTASASSGTYGAAQSDLDDVQSKRDDESTWGEELAYRAKKFSKRRFWWFCSVGIIFMIIFELSFLPRTSLSRDFRRWYKLHLTKADVKRNFLVYSGINRKYDNITNEQSLVWWLGNFTSLNTKSGVNLVAEDNHDLVSFVEKNFKKFGFDTKSYSYEVSSKLHDPISSSLRIVASDDEDGYLYNAKLYEEGYKTPAYYSYGYNGSVYSKYLYVNQGTKEDYELLLKNKIDPQGKIVIVRSINNNLSVGEKVSVAQYFGASGFVMYQYPLDGTTRENEKLSSLAIERNSLHGVEGINIPSIPISYKAVTPILDTLSEPSGPFKNWSRSPTPASNKLNLRLSTNFNCKPDKGRKLTNVVGTIEGILQDAEVIIGASRDSFTSTNPLSGHAIMMEIMKGFQRLRKSGWRPLRNIKFVSWDGTHNGLLGSQFFFNDTSAYDKRMPVLAYVNIDGDAVMGAQFKVDSNPALDHLIKNVAKYVPIPKDSSQYKTLFIDDEEQEILEDDINVGGSIGHGSTSLYHYWKKQDNNSINNIIGDSIKDSDALNFQQHLGVPVANIKFSNDPKRDPSIYTHNSNYYSLDWIEGCDIDRDMLLHGSLVRYLGLLTLSLSEHEIADRRCTPYAQKMKSFFNDTLYYNGNILEKWSSKEVPLYLLNKADIYTDLLKREASNIPDTTMEENGVVLFSNLTTQLNELIGQLDGQAKIYDEYNINVEEDLIKDYAWYHSYMKVKLYAQFKVANYKLLRIEQELMLLPQDYKYLYHNKTESDWFQHIVYGLSRFQVENPADYYKNREKRGVFPGIQSALEDEDFDQAIRWMVVTYAKLKGFSRKLT